MSREEAITKLKSFCHNCEKFPTCVNTDKKCFKALEMAIKALEEPVLDKIRAEISEYGSLWVEYKIEGHSDKDIEQIVEDVLKQAKAQVLDAIDKALKEQNG